METILVATDFSPASSRAVKAAAAFARDKGARMILLNVTQPESMLRDHARFVRAIAQMHGTAGKAGPGPVRGDTLQLVGDPVAVILAEAETLPADYIVLGSHRHSALHDLAVGSTAAGVLRGANCPVMIVTPRMRPALTRLKRRLDKRRVAARRKRRRQDQLLGALE
jgi:nucleotide-binding universal stress UspA family protein